MVDPKGIEPSNLTDANRALSQLSYGPINPFSGPTRRAEIGNGIIIADFLRL